jgi:DNA-binding XRE family transcriptional regulator
MKPMKKPTTARATKRSGSKGRRPPGRRRRSSQQQDGFTKSGEGPLFERPPAVRGVSLDKDDLVVTLERGDILRASLELLGIPRRPKFVTGKPSELEGGIELTRNDGTIVGISTDHILHVLSSRYDPKAAEKARESLRTRIAHRLRERRHQLQYTAEFVAQRAGLSRANYARMEAGKHLHQLDVLERVADVLRASLGDFVAQVEPMWLHRAVEEHREGSGAR